MDKIGKKTLEIMKEAKFYNRWLLGMFKPYLGNNILEIGSGIGNFTVQLEKFGEVTATDIDKYYLNKLRKLMPGKSGFGDIEKGKFFFENKKFNSIICLNVLEHINDDRSALRNMFNLLKKDGYLVLLVPAHQKAYTKIDKNLGHFRRYSVSTLKSKAEEVGFEISKIKYLNMPGIFGWFFNGKILRKGVIPKSQLKIFDKLFVPWLIIEKKIKIPIGLSVLLIAKRP